MIVHWLNCMTHPQYRCSHISEKEGQPASYTQRMHNTSYQRITLQATFLPIEQGLQFSDVCSRARQQVSIPTVRLTNMQKLQHSYSFMKLIFIHILNM